MSILRNSVFLVLSLLVLEQPSFANVSNRLENLLERCQERPSWEGEAKCFRRGINNILNNQGGGYGNPLECSNVNVYGKYAQGGGCNVYGCYYPGGGCNVYGCYYEGGSCNVYGCTREAPKTTQACQN